MSKRKHKSAISSQGNPLQLFRRTLHSKKNLRVGLATARARAKPEHIPLIVQQLSRSPQYEPILAPTTFPMSMSALTSKNRLGEISTEGELMWCASILSIYAPKLITFVKMRDEYNDAFLNANYERAEQLINSIQESFGVSLWLFGKKLLLLQTTTGLQAQKNFLEEVVSTEGINQFIAWITFFLSLRSEENVSYTNFEQEAEEILTLPWLHDYVRLHWVPSLFASIKDPGLPISLEEPHPIIDRFETFVAMALNYCIKYGAGEKGILVKALEQVESIGDIRIKRMLMVLRDGYSSENSQILRFADAYTEGNYQEVIYSECEAVELVARSYALVGARPLRKEKPSLRHQIITLMCDALTLSVNAFQSRQMLRKLALLSPSLSLTFQITAFLQRAHNHVIGGDSSDLDIAAAICGSLDNPWSAPALGKVCVGEPWLSQLLREHATSPALKLWNALETSDVLALQRNEISMPQYRKSMYLGHIDFRAGNFDSAANNYLKAAQESVDFISFAAKRYLFEAYYAASKLIDAAQLAIDQILANPSATELYPLERLATQYLKLASPDDAMNSAILLHLATRHCNAKLERDLSNAYENVLDNEEITKPSALEGRGEKYNRERLVYFLRYVCVPRVLDDTIYFESVEEIDAERIAVCQALLRLDPQNTSLYQSEIRALTRESEVAHLLSKMQISKIYVDEAGIRESLEVTLSDYLTRYHQLLNSPSLAYQTEKLSKRLSEMLSGKGHPEFKDLKLPASEIEGLFHSILLEFVSEFALNPAYGLDTHVSTSIRHGAFEGHLRRPLAVEDLLCVKEGNKYLMSPAWRRKIPNLNAESYDLIQKQMVKFTQRFEEVIREYLKNKLHVRVVGDDVAMFDFHSSQAESQALMESITPNTNLDDLMDHLMAHCWDLTTRSLDAIRLDLSNYAATQVAMAFDTLIGGVESKLEHSSITPLIDAIARARTAFQDEIEDVAEWFQRPTDLARDPFDIEVATHVALQQITNCYVRNPIDPELNLSVDAKIDGDMLDGLCEILFILLQNVILHGELGEQKTRVYISASRHDATLVLECKSQLAEHVSLSERRDCAVDAMSKYQRDSALKMARKEGGSGLSKVWRIAEFDLRVKHGIELSVTEEREFVVRLSLDGIWKL